MTIKDIARLSGCGTATVSRVLNGHSDVSDATRARVLAVVKEQDFQLNRNAKRLKQQASAGVALLLTGPQNMLYPPLAEQLQFLLHAEGLHSAVHYLDGEEDETAYAARLCQEQKPLGIFFLGGDLARFRAGARRVTVPAVLLTASARGLDHPRLSSLSIDDRAAAAQAIDHLAELGHRQIGILGGPAGGGISALRLAGCEDGFARHGLPFDRARQYETCRYAMGDGYRAAVALLDRAPELTALFAMSDVMALGAIRALADRGLQVPRDLSVMGFDGIPMARYSLPRLTTISQDVQQLAGDGVRALLDGIRTGTARHETVPFRLLPGESTAPPAGHSDQKGGDAP